jgi:uncharacterized protein (DUF433 family)
MRTADARAHFEERIVHDTAIMGGEAVIRGTRVLLRTVLATLAEGATPEEVLTDFPTLTIEDVRAVIAFVAANSSVKVPTFPGKGLHPGVDLDYSAALLDRMEKK